MVTAAVAPKQFATLPRLAEGGTVVCLAPGPSLTQADVEYVRGKATVIAVNDAVDAAPWADVAYSSDSGWWIRRKGLPTFPGLRVTVGSRPQGLEGQFDGMLVLRLMQIEGVCFKANGLATAKNSGGAAINLAVHLLPEIGVRRILLSGYDLGPSGRRYHFNEPPQGASKPSSNYEKFRGYIATMAKPLSDAGIEVINCSRKTALTCFPRRSLADVLSSVEAQVA